MGCEYHHFKTRILSEYIPWLFSLDTPYEVKMGLHHTCLVPVIKQTNYDIPHNS